MSRVIREEEDVEGETRKKEIGEVLKHIFMYLNAPVSENPTHCLSVVLGFLYMFLLGL